MFLSACNNDDPCEGVICFVGNCDNGICVCPVGYTGDDCGTEITPSKILVSAIRVLEFPGSKENGDPWDISDNPDLGAILFKNGDLIWESSVIFFDVEFGEIYSFGSIPPIDITDVEDMYTLNLVDDDDGSVEFMGEYSFSFYASNNGFPTHPTLGNSPLRFVLDLEYEW